MKGYSKLFWTLVFAILHVSLHSQVNEVWRYQFNGPGYSDFIRAMKVDEFGQIYLTGDADSSGKERSETVVISNSGVLLWNAEYSGPNQTLCQPYSISIDSSGNVYVGCISSISANGYPDKTILIKYDKQGQQRWLSTYIGNFYSAGDLAPVSNSVNQRNFSAVATSSDWPNTNYDPTVILIDSSGNQVWVNHVSGPLGTLDYACSVAFDFGRNVFLLGTTVGDTTGYDITTAKYSPAGEQLWVARYNGAANGSDSAMAMVLDLEGNVYVTGRSWGGVSTKYDYVTIKYNMNGVQQWAARYDGGVSDDDVPHAICVDNYGNVYVTGESRQPVGHSVYLTIKYSPAGDQLWAVKYEYQGGDFGYFMTMDKSGYIYVAGNSVEGIRTHIAIVKYSPLGEQLWVTRTQSVDGESSAGLAVDSSYNVYLAANDGHYLVIKYSQVIGIQPISNGVPKGFSLKQNYPNPFNPSTNIEFSVPKSSFVTLKVYDALGREVRSLVNENLAAGTYRAQFEASNLASGMYYYKMTAIDEATKSSFVDTKPMVLVK